ncbi:hypothetical protein [Hymenobacter sp. AT01-02]|uniref:hypothetical protein n=1 Tax=Hymenobacter sp. AT01-02 TaxID=1571877 RepID=UPI0005F1FA79|nr:hypothetical protein [Hymenobacter sp. AT01-02]
MKKTLFLLSCAVGLTMASCSQDKTADTATTDGAATTTTTTTTSTSYSDDAIQRRADRMAADMAAKMKFDEATREKVRTAYINRGKRLGELQQQYASDTAGRAAAMRDAYASSDTEFKSIFTDPTQYSAYESSRTEYMDDRYMDDDAISASSSDMSMDSSGTGNSTMSSSAGSSMSSGMQGSADGGKMKIKRDGDVKIKDAEAIKPSSMLMMAP